MYAAYNVLKHHGWLPKKNLKGEHVFITGAGMGIGRYLSIELAKLGCKLSLSDINLETLAETSTILIVKDLNREIGGPGYW